VQIDVLTLFPQMFEGPMGLSMMWKAQERGLLHLHLHDLRDWGEGRRRQVDDTPCGGGGGMILRADVLVRIVREGLRPTMALHQIPMVWGLNQVTVCNSAKAIEMMWNTTMPGFHRNSRYAW